MVATTVVRTGDRHVETRQYLQYLGLLKLYIQIYSSKAVNVEDGKLRPYVRTEAEHCKTMLSGTVI